MVSQLSLIYRQKEQKEVSSSAVRPEPPVTRIRPGEHVKEIFNTPIHVNNQAVIRKAEDECEPGSADFYYRSALDHLGSGRIGNAIADLHKAIELMPDFIDAYRDLGSIYKTTGQFEEALTLCDKALSLDQNYAEAWSRKGLCLFSLERFDEAIAACTRALVLNGNDPTAWYIKGVSLDEVGKAAEAQEAFGKSLELEIILDMEAEKRRTGK